jgi:hypothetical protein
LPISPIFDLSMQDSARKSDPGWKRDSGDLSTRDELLMSLMASDAVIDSREFDILSAEEIEDLKKVGTILPAVCEFP